MGGEGVGCVCWGRLLLLLLLLLLVLLLFLFDVVVLSGGTGKDGKRLFECGCVLFK